MLVHKIIFRLDFKKVSFDIIDRPGSVLRILDEAGEKFWSEYQDSTQGRVVRAHFKSDAGGLYRQMNVEPMALNFVLEDAEGIKWPSLENNESFSTIFKSIHAICEQFKIDEFSRAGLRFVLLGEIGEKGFDLRPVIESLFAKELIAIVTGTLGAASDHGMAFDGLADDKVKYHLKCGPFQAREAKGHFEQIAQRVADVCVANFICDLDLYEESFALKGNRAVTWTRPLVQKAQKLATNVEKFLAAQIN